MVSAVIIDRHNESSVHEQTPEEAHNNEHHDHCNSRKSLGLQLLVANPSEAVDLGIECSLTARTVVIAGAPAEWRDVRGPKYNCIALAPIEAVGPAEGVFAGHNVGVASARRRWGLSCLSAAGIVPLTDLEVVVDVRWLVCSCC